MLTVEPSVSQETYWRIHQFLLHETALLDERRLSDWLELVTPDFLYRIPVPVTRDNPALAPYSETAYLVEESRASIETLWAARYEPKLYEYAWGENPPQRVRRFLSNTRVTLGEEPGTYVARSNVLLSFARLSDPVILASGGREDLLREHEDGFRIAARTVYLDGTVVTLTHMRVVF